MGKISRIIWCSWGSNQTYMARRLADHPCTDQVLTEEVSNPCMGRTSVMSAEEAWQIWSVSLRTVYFAAYCSHSS